MSDIVERLHEYSGLPFTSTLAELLREAAAELTRLRAQLAERERDKAFDTQQMRAFRAANERLHEAYCDLLESWEPSPPTPTQGG